MLSILFSSAYAFEDSLCFDSNGSVYDCLIKELRVAEKLERQKVKQLIAKVESATVASTNSEMDKKAKASVIAGINTADEKWRSLVKVECGDLIDIQFFGGNGGPNASIDCMISRTNARIKEISESDSYKFWSQQ
ncbi:DUF1311 domain-containing protein [Duganella sp. BJB488]|uniref:lysozyme inhibitor LprI family protein n=1 Tax=unclassified Duganella TaxID=2636909 RepID=UPI000E350223|nr:MULTISPECIES: lysozyme inhibitor LprI family protein [unclassified Duganella]RFP13002.1 DUF1311 domain-containing protein [Duganella sp. BJB488]RFP29272.1 DUF1311 domain-containing protein [Duganella sp. BJB480]